MKLEKTFRHRIEGVPNAVQFYCYKCPADGRDEIFEVWSCRDIEAIALAATTLEASFETPVSPLNCVTLEYIGTNIIPAHTTKVTQEKEQSQSLPTPKEKHYPLSLIGRWVRCAITGITVRLAISVNSGWITEPIPKQVKGWVKDWEQGWHVSWMALKKQVFVLLPPEVGM